MSQARCLPVLTRALRLGWPVLLLCAQTEDRRARLRAKNCPNITEAELKQYAHVYFSFVGISTRMVQL